jgi:deoxyribose-phosphate aldolase
MYLSLVDFKKRVEFSLCQQFANEDDVRFFCRNALDTGVGVVCVNPVNIPLTAKLLKGAGIEISGNIGFPFGSHLTEVKALETKRAVEAGATQIDMVINVGALRSKKDDLVMEDIQKVVEAAQGRVVKAIIETWILTDQEKERACRITERAGANLVKTTTGVRTQYLLQINPDPKGSTLEDIYMMRRVLSPRMRIKASGGIYSLDFALKLLRAGADQMGMSQGAKIVGEFQKIYGEGVDLDKI